MANEKTAKPSHFAVKSCDIKATILDVSTSDRTVTGFYNTYNFIDSDGDVLLPNCAKRTIKNNGPKSSSVAKIKHALNHDLCELPGKIQTLEERIMNVAGYGNIEGIYFETLMADTELGNDTLKNYMAEIYDNHSIGFRYVMDKLTMVERDSKAAWDKVVSNLINPQDAETRTWLWTVGEIKLFEGSTVAFGANSLTPFLGMAKAMTKDGLVSAMVSRITRLEKALKVGTQTDDMLQRFEIETLQVKQMLEDLTDYLILDADTEASLIRKAAEREAEAKRKAAEEDGPPAKKIYSLNVSGFTLD